MRIHFERESLHKAAYDVAVHGVTKRLVVVAVLGAASNSRGVAAEPPTPLLSDDLRANKRTVIDAPKDALDADLDAALGGPEGFSTKELARVEDRLKAELERDRPRASPRLVVFMYPGRVSAERLRAMREVFVDIELTIDPCSRTVCEDALGRHVELVGRAVGEAVVRAQSFSIVYKTLTLKAETDVRGEELITVVLPVADAVAAAKRAGGGAALVADRRRQDTDYVPLLTKAIAAETSRRRVSLARPPAVSRGTGSVEVSLKVKADRSRQEQQVLDAVYAAGIALASSPATPTQGRIEIEADTGSRGIPASKFRCPLDPAIRYGKGALDGKAMLTSYLERVNEDKNAQRMDLDSGGDGNGAPAPDDGEAIAAISASFSSVGACAKAEAGANPKFRGVTVIVGWTGSGRASSVDVKEAALKSGPLVGCLKRAFENIALPRFSGDKRTIEYPIKLK